LRLQRRIRAQLSDRASGSMDQGQVARHVRPVGPWLVTKDENRGRAKACRCGSTSTASDARPARPRP
jgi:hypothetical protein